MVAKPRASTRCAFCQTTYDLGDPVGNLFIFYPDANQRYWNHCTTDIHQQMLATLHITILGQLKSLPTTLSSARTAQKDATDPARLALKELLR